MPQASHHSRPPGFLKLISHPVRWNLLQLLARSDLRVQELVRGTGEAQNLVSYHLQAMRQQGIIQNHRSIADGREVYYSLNMDRVRSLYRASGAALHPALGERESLPSAGPSAPARVLFLCTHNSARSQMAEGLLRARSSGRVEVFSAGTEPTQVHLLAIRALSEMKIDIHGHRSKGMQAFLGQSFDYVITVCDRARESCPTFPGDPANIHWSFPDPAAVEGSESERFSAFRKTAVQLNTRIGYLLLMIQRDQE
jgi:protein-tyrosine-phosphatase